jgi:hypothetical protein
MALTTAAAALQILNGTWTALQNMRERVQASKDNGLKEGFGSLLDDFNSLRTVVLQLTEENDAMRQAQVETPPKPEIRQVGETNYYFVRDEGPYCQKCFDKDSKLVRLGPRLEGWTFGSGRKCEICGTIFHEEHKPAPRAQIKPWNWT